MQKALIESFGLGYANPSSFHARGQRCRHAIEEARETIASEIGAEPGDLVFTSGGTEADNLAVKGVMAVQKEKGRDHLVISSVEHQAVLHPAEFLRSHGYSITVVPVDRRGHVDLEALGKAVNARTGLVSVMHANNEVGTYQDVQAVSRIAHAAGALFHVDAVQTFGKIRLSAEDLGADLISLSSHKICGPKGTGALYAKKGVKLRALLHGGHQEKNVRPGTENVHGIFGFARAVQVASELREVEMRRVHALRDQLERGLLTALGGLSVNGDEHARLYNTTSLTFDGLDGETLLMNLDLKGIYVSTGSACTAGSVEPSHVLLAMGLSEKAARGTIRFSLGRFSTDTEVDHVLKELPPIVDRLRAAHTGKR